MEEAEREWNLLTTQQVNVKSGEPQPVGHIHSNGDFCAERQVESRDWPVNLYTADQMREAILAERERCAKLCELMQDGYGHWKHGTPLDCANEIRKG